MISHILCVNFADNVHFVHVSCGSDVAWACDRKGIIYMRVGSLKPPGPNDMSPAWVQVEGSPMSMKNCIFTKVKYLYTLVFLREPF